MSNNTRYEGDSWEETCLEGGIKMFASNTLITSLGKYHASISYKNKEVHAVAN